MPELVAGPGRVERALHDLASPLTIIRAVCFELGREEDDPARRRRLDVIDDQVGRLRAGLAALREDAVPESRRCLGVADLVAGAVTRLSPVARSGGKLLTGSMTDDAKVLGDAARLDRALDNLVTNALRHCRRRVVISTAGSGADRIAILVGDDGPGVRAQERERIFRAGYRGEAAPAPGRGIGLSIAADVATEHGGTLRLMPSGGGALFRLDLPALRESRISRGAA